MHWYQYTKTQIASELKTDLDQGLTEAEAQKRLKEHGLNILPEKEPDGYVKIFFRQFQSPLIYILLVCAAIVFYLGEHTDAVIILVVVVSNALIGMYQEGKSGRVLRSLKRLTASEAVVIRSGQEMILPEAEVTVGDVLVLTEGQKIPADARIIFNYNLSTDESSLTGETGAVLKKEAAYSDADLPVSSQHNMVFKGSSILSGDGKAVVVATGLNTEFGKISKALLEPEEDIPLQRNIKSLSKLIIAAMVVICVALFVLGVATGRPIRELFSVIVSLAVSIIPEGLPLVLTLILATGVWRMSKKNALVKKMQAVESLGRAKVIAVDKTGTLTENQMVIKQLYAGDKIYTISGNGYEPKGQACINNQVQTGNHDITMAAIIASLVSKVAVIFNEQTSLYKVTGDPTEAAMTVLGEKLGFGRENLQEHYQEIAEIPFDYKNKFRAVFYEHDKQVFCAVAGAPEVLLKHSTHYLCNGQHHEISEKQHLLFEETIEDFSAKGLRLVAFGYKRLPKVHPLDNINNLVLGGFFGIEDAIRPEAKAAVKAAEEAGVRVVMITGDLKATAKAIAREADIYHEGDLVITGSELQELSEIQLAEKLPKVTVFARVTPEDKMKIIKAFKHAGIIVAMTGDGVNDAPSLVAADLGVAMGKIGTEVAKEAADIVLLDDNLFSIVAAIQEGRVMYQNIKKALQFLFSTSLGELLVIVAAMVLNMPLPLLAVQILWMNLITDPLLAGALAVEKKESDLMHQSALKYSKYFIDGPMLIHMILVGGIMTVSGLWLFGLYDPIDHVKALTVSLTVLSVIQWYNGLNCRFLTKSIFTTKIFTNRYIWLSLLINLILQLLAVYNPWFNKILHTSPLSFMEWVIILGVSFTVILAEEIRKLFYRLRI